MGEGQTIRPGTIEWSCWVCSFHVDSFWWILGVWGLSAGFWWLLGLNGFLALGWRVELMASRFCVFLASSKLRRNQSQLLVNIQYSFYIYNIFIYLYCIYNYMYLFLSLTWERQICTADVFQLFSLVAVRVVAGSACLALTSFSAHPKAGPSRRGNRDSHSLDSDVSVRVFE